MTRSQYTDACISHDLKKGCGLFLIHNLRTISLKKTKKITENGNFYKLFSYLVVKHEMILIGKGVCLSLKSDCNTLFYSATFNVRASVFSLGSVSKFFYILKQINLLSRRNSETTQTMEETSEFYAQKQNCLLTEENCQNGT